MSESNKFTPGPWVVSKDDSEIEKFVVAARGTVCEVFESFTADSVWGNAFLISAAPDLLEAIEGVLRISDLWLPHEIEEQHGEEMYVLHMARNKMIAAVEKARGQQ